MFRLLFIGTALYLALFGWDIAVDWFLALGWYNIIVFPAVGGIAVGLWFMASDADAGWARERRKK